MQQHGDVELSALGMGEWFVIVCFECVFCWFVELMRLWITYCSNCFGSVPIGNSTIENIEKYRKWENIKTEYWYWLCRSVPLKMRKKTERYWYQKHETLSTGTVPKNLIGNWSVPVPLKIQKNYRIRKHEKQSIGTDCVWWVPIPLKMRIHKNRTVVILKTWNAEYRYRVWCRIFWLGTDQYRYHWKYRKIIKHNGTDAKNMKNRVPVPVF